MVALCLLGFPAIAALNIKTFQPGEVIRAVDMNQNFHELADAILDPGPVSLDCDSFDEASLTAEIEALAAQGPKKSRSLNSAAVRIFFCQMAWGPKLRSVKAALYPWEACAYTTAPLKKFREKAIFHSETSLRSATALRC